MKQINFEKLQDGDKVLHKHFGKCTVTGYLPEFGPIISPDTEDGKMLFRRMSGDDAPLLETSNRLVQKFNV